MIADLAHVPFSTAGSYLAFSQLTGEDRPSETVRLRTVRGGVRERDLLEVLPLTPAGPTAGVTHVQPTEVTIAAPGGSIRATFITPQRIRLHCDGVGALIRSEALGPYDTLVQRAPDEWQYLRYSAHTTLRIRLLRGTMRSLSTWDGVRTGLLMLAADSGTMVEVEEMCADACSSVRSSSEWVIPSFPEFLDGMPDCGTRHARTRELAAYVLWSGLVEPSGFVKRPTILMSKNWMTNIWSWDHCFNAMALEGFPALARHQYFSIFDHQTRDGRLPDYINDASRSYTFVKPPIHGWALLRMSERGLVDESWLAAAYQPLASWTKWWLTHRTLSPGSLPVCYHGNDSGWDNSTAFMTGVPLESPDLAAFLVVQTDFLSTAAANLGMADQAHHWQQESQRLLDLLLERLWTGDRFVARSNGHVIESSSLLTRLPVVLGNRLPPEIVCALASDIGSPQFLTEKGLATESIRSSGYVSDGYWRGPMWAPATLLIVDGLAEAGETATAERITETFCDTVARSGMAENFDALSGGALRDRAYSWTASVFLTLASRLSSGRLRPA